VPHNLLFPNLCGALDMVHGLPSGGCGDSSAEREFPSDKVYRRDDRGIVGVESLGLQGLASASSFIHTSVGRAGDAPGGSAAPRLSAE
jgi:hypothetical protein